MAFPPGVQTVTLTGHQTLADGSGRPLPVRIRPVPTRVVSAAHGVVVDNEPVVVRPNDAGEWSVELVAVDAEGFTPTGWTYRVETGDDALFVSLPTALGTVDIADLTPAGYDGGEYVLVQGPPGTPADESRVTALEEQMPLKADKAEAAFTGAVQINGAPGAVAPALPAGYGSSAEPTGLTLGSTYPSDDVAGGTDGTGRLNLYSYQRANTYSFGEVLRAFAMRKDSKQMLAWYHPVNGYAADRTPNAGAWKPVTWVGTHWESNGHTGNHKHWEVEIPDSAGALHGRLEILFGRQSDETIGLDKTNIITNLADLTVRCHGTDTSGGDIQQALRLSASAGFEKPIEWANDTDGVGKRWKLRATSETEAGSNAGTNMQLLRYNDSGVLIDIPFQVNRATGQVTVGGTGGTSAGLAVNRNGGVALAVQALAAGGQAVLASGPDAATAAYQAAVTGDTVNRYRVLTDGTIEWGSGSATRDVKLYRSSAGVLKTDTSFHIVQNLRMNTTSVGGGVGVIGVANASTVPGSNPSGGGVLYAEGGALKWRGSNGTVTVIAPA